MSAQYLTKRARTLIRDGNFQDAVDKLKTALEQDPEFTAAHNLLGVAQSRLGNEKNALAAFRKGKNLAKENPVLHFNLAIALETTGQPDKAAPRYRAAFRLHPGWLDAMNALGLVLFRQKDYDGANRIFSKVLKLDPENVEALNNKGLVLADQDQHTDAIKKYHAALEIDGTYINAGLNLARALEDTENFAASLEELERLADLVPADWEVRIRLAALYHKLERYDEAMDQVRAILEEEPDNIRALRIEGALQLIQGNDEEAKGIFERITALDSTGESEDSDRRFMITDPESRYWLDLVPPPAVMLPDPPASKPASTRPGANRGVARKTVPAKARATKKAAKVVPAKRTPKPASTHPGAIAPAKARAVKKAAQAAPVVKAPKPAPEIEFPELEPIVEVPVVKAPEPVSGAEVSPGRTSSREESTVNWDDLRADREKSSVDLMEGKLLSLMRYLMNLTEALPEPVQDEFMHSDERMEIKYIIDTLENVNE
jgi:tetratricopeptide (TPR) repeat protein